MTFEEYTARQRAVIAALVAVLLVLLTPFLLVGLGRRSWLAVLAAIYPHAERARRASAELARQFYDAERRRRTGITESRPIFLAEYRPEWFEDAMGAARNGLSRENATRGALARAIAVAAKEAENGGRHTMLRAIESDPVVQGWTRVAGGIESCAFCTMLISRGPVYTSAENAGLDADDTSAVELWRQIDTAETPRQRQLAQAAFDELMTRWHPNCDCKVVPVFDRANWPGRDAFLVAQRLWANATKGHSGSDALNALRRAMNAGDTNESGRRSAA